jgi:hypothetical protein
MQGADHGEGQASLPVENLGNAGSRAEDGLQVLAGAPLLLEAELDGLDRVGGEDGGMCTLVGVHEGAEDVELVEFGGTERGIPKALDFRAD